MTNTESREGWASTRNWRGVEQRALYFAGDERLSFQKPAASTRSRSYDEYLSNPADPLPYWHRPIGPTYPGPGWPTWLVEDQRFVERRPDVLTYATEPLAADLSIAGDIGAHLFASTRAAPTVTGS